MWKQSKYSIPPSFLSPHPSSPPCSFPMDHSIIKENSQLIQFKITVYEECSTLLQTYPPPYPLEELKKRILLSTFSLRNTVVPEASLPELICVLSMTGSVWSWFQSETVYLVHLSSTDVDRDLEQCIILLLFVMWSVMVESSAYLTLEFSDLEDYIGSVMANLNCLGFICECHDPAR